MREARYKADNAGGLQHGYPMATEREDHVTASPGTPKPRCGVVELAVESWTQRGSLPALMNPQFQLPRHSLVPAFGDNLPATVVFRRFLFTASPSKATGLMCNRFSISENIRNVDLLIHKSCPGLSLYRT